jgi:hypothetical protein
MAGEAPWQIAALKFSKRVRPKAWRRQERSRMRTPTGGSHRCGIETDGRKAVWEKVKEEEGKCLSKEMGRMGYEFHPKKGASASRNG